jgi:cobalt-zinc-cadmium efflux system outer membrane protein
MERLSSRGLAVLASAAVLSGCATVPPQRGAEGVNALVTARGERGVTWPAERGAGPESQQSAGSEQLAGGVMPETGPLSRADAVRYAFMHNPRVQQLYAELGIASANVLEAGRFANPRFGYVSLAPEGGGLSQITRSVSLDFTNALLLPSRARLARGEFERTRELVADALLALATRVEAAWYAAVSARQVAELRELAASAGEASGEMARRLYEAGNVSPKALALEQATSTEQRVAAARAKADAVRARTALAEAMGVSARHGWAVPARLPAIANDSSNDPGNDTAGDKRAVTGEAALVKQAQTLRLDLSAARHAVATSEDLARVTRRWRWVGDVEGGYEWESDTDGSRLRGPSLSLGLPIFNQNQGGVLRADARAEAARARLAEMETRVRNDVARGLDRMAAAREVARAYRTALLPQHEAVVNRTQEEHNYMLVGVFELLQAKRAQLDAYQAYLEAVRDYWVARAELRRAVGGNLPGDESIGTSDPLTPGFDELLAPPSPGQTGQAPGEGPRSPPLEQHTEHEHHGETP